ncbi:hypothetical protein WR25_08857 [Diploscapter pachys]|uniref:DUF4440 domain-containing protein n=1 Tax=Diploscapter pachys TaxID=2018661 RepID=A0A2A2JAN8_9BILA|nr:hypothetical protein WR25_08857 [Diploscapter pachys]
MALSTEQIHEILKELEVSRAADLKSKDLDRLVTNNYHPDGIMIMHGPDGVKTFYGREAHKEAVRPFLFADNTDSQLTTTYVESSRDGEFIIRCGTYQFGSSTKEHKFEVIFRKLNGKYLIYHQDVHYCPDSP